MQLRGGIGDFGIPGIPGSEWSLSLHGSLMQPGQQKNMERFESYLGEDLNDSMVAWTAGTVHGPYFFRSR